MKAKQSEPVQLAGELDPETMVRPVKRAEELELGLLTFKVMSPEDQQAAIDRNYGAG